MRENQRMEWRVATIETVSKIIEHDLKECDDEQAAAFTMYRVEPYCAPVILYGRDEGVVVVARRQVRSFTGKMLKKVSTAPELVVTVAFLNIFAIKMTCALRLMHGPAKIGIIHLASPRVVPRLSAKSPFDNSIAASRCQEGTIRP
jgi:hypothetical protein